MNLDKEQINNYISKNANSTIQRRALRLFKVGAVKSFETDEHFNSTIVKVQGGKLYSVTINYTGSLRSSCNCPYDWGGICKHEVAALYHIRDFATLEVKKITPPKNKKISLKARNTSSWSKIPEHKKLTFQSVNQLSTPENFTASKVYQKQKLLNLTQKGFEIEIPKYWDTETVEFQIKAEVLKIRCSCQKKVKGICEHEISALLFILSNFDDDFFNFFEPKFIEEFKSKISKEYGINEDENFDDWFSIDFSEGVKVLPTNKGRGLIKLEKYRINENEGVNKFQSILKSKQEQNLVRVNEQKLIEVKIGFSFNSINDNIFELVPITGKPNKNKDKLSTFIRQLDEMERSHSVFLNDEELHLVELCKKISQQQIESHFENIYNRNFYTDSDLTNEEIFDVLTYYMSKIKEIRALISKQSYTYKSNSSNIGRNTIEQISFSPKIPKIVFMVSEKDNLIVLEPTLNINDNIISLSEIERLHSLVFEFFNSIYFLDTVKDAFILNEFELIDAKRISKTEFDYFFENYIKPISEHYPVDFFLPDYKINTSKMEVKHRRIYISELGNFVVFKPYIVYEDEQLINILQKNNKILSKKDKTIYVGERNTDFEHEFNEFIKELHPKFRKQFPEDFYHLTFDEMIDKYWFFDAFEKFKEHNIEVLGIKDLKKFKYSPNKANVSINIKSGQDWFDVKVNVKFGELEVSLKDIRKAVVNKEKYIKLSDGTIGMLPEEWIDKFSSYFRQGEMKKNELKISKLNFSIIDELFDEKDYSNIIDELLEKRNRLKNFTKIKNASIPKKFKGTLRDYQVSGYNWLNFLDEYQWGGILADDMGLGKTIQILAFLLKQIKKSKKANLIVIPTSLLFNWDNEIQKFAPSIKPYFHYGTNRIKKHNEFSDYDLVITTYGTLTRDIKLLQKYSFNYAILDESQAIKNPNSQRFKAATLIKAKNKLALTGTPIENNTFDLYAQMDFINPGFLGGQNNFKKNYSNPIDKEQDPIIAAELQRKISPFVLRRTKEQVATELPSKTEDYVFCEMQAEQRSVYEAMKNKYRDMLLKRIDDNGLGKSKIYVLDGLTKLRQICDSPELLPGKEDYGNDSVKIRELISHINEKTGNHKILVFSQFVKMLSIIRRELDNDKIKYEYLDGKSSKKARENSVTNFQNNKKVRVFLISLKAGGTGLNLTAADYVYIVDPWWNPAVENQAIDRCYRIGQDKKVIAYRMICKDTIEEKIMKYQAKKKQIASDIITTDESFVKQLKKTDIEDLFN